MSDGVYASPDAFRIGGYEHYREFLLAIASAAAILAGFNALVFIELFERRLLTAEHLKGRRRHVWIPVVFIAAGTVAVLISLFLAVDTILLYQEGEPIAADSAGQLGLTRQAFNFGYIASFLGFLVLGVQVWRRVSKPERKGTPTAESPPFPR